MREFSEMKNNVAARILDESTAMKTLIGKFLNKRYQQVLRAIHWDAINEQSISVTSAAQDYDLDSDFGSPIAITNTTNNLNIILKDLSELHQDYPGAVSDTGDVERAAIYRDSTGAHKIKFHYYPTTALTVVVVYHIKPAALSADGSKPILPIEDLLETGAEADAWRYKRQFAKAGVLETLFTKELSEAIWEQENNALKTQQMIPATCK